MSAHYVYRHYDADGRLLCVGMTKNPARRPYERRDRPWIGDSARVDVSGPMSHDEAAAVERRVIAEEKPLHNVYRNNGNKTALYRYYEAQAAAMTPEDWAAARARAAEVASQSLRLAFREATR
jgi:hypothetical protein